MRCWQCFDIIVTPDYIDGRVGKAGEIRARDPSRPAMDPPFTVHITFHCPKCGTVYDQTIKMTERKVNTKMGTPDGEQ